MEKFLRRLHWWFIFILIALIAILGIILFHVSRERLLTVVFLDIGQGDAIYIETPNHHQVLVDGGPDRGVLSALGHVMIFSDRSIDMLIESHPDKDHIGGFVDVVENFKIDTYLYPGIESDTGIYERLQDLITLYDLEKIQGERGMRVYLDRQYGIFMDILFPDYDVSHIEDRNDGSLVVRLVYGETSFLLTGDVGIDVEYRLIKNLDNNVLDTDVLKLGHHGSKTSTSKEFLIATTPELAIISAGMDNRYGHPNAEVLENLAYFQIPYLGTYTEGNITFQSNGHNIFVK